MTAKSRIEDGWVVSVESSERSYPSLTVFDVDGLLTVVQNGGPYGSSVRWTHIDPLGLSEAGDTKAVYDPMGNYIPWSTIRGQACDLRFSHSFASDLPNANIHTTLVKVQVLKAQRADAKALQ